MPGESIAPLLVAVLELKTIVDSIWKARPWGLYSKQVAQN